MPAFGRGGTDLDWEGGIPHREGAWTFTASGTSDRAPFAGLDDDERVRHKGELLYPNLMLSLSADHVAAFTLWPTAAGPHPHRLRPAVRPGRGRAATPSTPSDAADFWDLVNRQDWAICESVQRGMSSRALHAGLVRADGGRQPRHPALAAAAAGASRERRRRVEEADTVVVGLGGLGSATAWQLARRGVRRRRARAVRARAPARRVARHVADPAPQLPHAGVRRGWPARRTTTGRASSRRAASTLVTVTGGVDLFPPGAAIPVADYVDSMARRAGAVRAARRGRRSPRAGRRCGCPRAPSRSAPGRTRRSSRPAAATATMAAARPGGRRPAARPRRR